MKEAPNTRSGGAILVTGVAGFIGFHCARTLLERGEIVIGVDNLSDYYPVELKRARLAILEKHRDFRFNRVDLSETGALEAAVAGAPIARVIHLAAQPGIRRSLTEPQSYITANLVGHANVLEFCRGRGDLEHLVYASSSSVYGNNTKQPFSETDRVDQPASLYAATKRADELMSYAYAGLYGLPQTGLRFFTVYGPWGRPDMAVWTFTEAILNDRPIRLFNGGDLRRDFTYIDDIVSGVLAVLDGPPLHRVSSLHRIYNIGNNRPVSVKRLVALLEEATGRAARIEIALMQAGDMIETAADITAIEADFGFSPATPIEVGIPRFVDWYRARSKAPHEMARAMMVRVPASSLGDEPGAS